MQFRGRYPSRNRRRHENIADIQIGDFVLGYNEQTETFDFFEVTATHSQHHETMLDVTIAGEVIHTTNKQSSPSITRELIVSLGNKRRSCCG